MLYLSTQPKVIGFFCKQGLKPGINPKFVFLHFSILAVKLPHFVLTENNAISIKTVKHSSKIQKKILRRKIY